MNVGCGQYMGHEMSAVVNIWDARCRLWSGYGTRDVGSVVGIWDTTRLCGRDMGHGTALRLVLTRLTGSLVIPCCSGCAGHGSRPAAAARHQRGGRELLRGRRAAARRDVRPIPEVGGGCTGGR